MVREEKEAPTKGRGAMDEKGGYRDSCPKEGKHTLLLLLRFTPSRFNSVPPDASPLRFLDLERGGDAETI